MEIQKENNIKNDIEDTNEENIWLNKSKTIWNKVKYNDLPFILIFFF